MTNTQNQTLHYSAQIKAFSEKGESKYFIHYKFYDQEELIFDREELIFECEYQLSADDYSDILKEKKNTEHFEPSGFSLDEYSCDHQSCDDYYIFGFWSKK